MFGVGRVRRPLLALSLFLVGVALLLRRMFSGPWGENLLPLVERSGHLAPLLLIAACVVASLLLLPGTPLALASGFLFGFPRGFLVMSAGTLLGTAAAFGLGRLLLGDRIDWRDRVSPLVGGILSAVERRGFAIVFFSRLSPFFPYNVLNYAYAATPVPPRTFFAGSMLGVLPVTAFNVYVGTLMRSLSEIAGGEFDIGRF